MHGATPGAPKNGPSLLVGIVLCGKCGRRMRVDYSTNERVQWRYLCEGNHHSGEAICWSVLGEPIDLAVEKLFLDTMVPSEIDLSLAVEREASGQAVSLNAQWKTRLEQARYEARRAERRYKAVDPENRVVARTLEAEWEARLQDLNEVERQYADARRERRVDLTPTDREALRAIARDLPGVWRGATTAPADRKAMLRLVIEVITIEPIDIPKRATRVRVQWRSGVIDDLFVERPGWGLTPASVVERIRELTAGGLHDDEVAARLNSDGMRTAKNLPWTASAVIHVRCNNKITKARRPRRTVLPDRHPTTNEFSVRAAAVHLGVTKSMVEYWIKGNAIPSRRERYAQYDAVWLDISDELAAKLRKPRRN
jgi:hypothetical protein